MTIRSNMAGIKIGRLIVIELAPYIPGKERVKWVCKCDCGNMTITSQNNLQRQTVRSCGCLQLEAAAVAHKTHGMTKTNTYQIWRGIIKRCTCQNDPKFADYGAKGITVCDRWRTFENFLSDMGICPRGLQIDRINNTKGYFPGNCRWTTSRVNNNNKSNNVVLEFNGEKHTKAEWERKLGISRGALAHRLESGWSLEKTLTFRRN